MTDREQKLTPPTGIVWPPAPLHVAVPPPLFMSAEGIKVTQSGGRLVVLNKLIRFVCAAQTCLMLLALLLMLSFPWIDQWVVPYHNIPRPALLPSMISSYQSGYIIYLEMLLEIIALWCLFVFYLSLGNVVLDQVNETVKANGKLRPISKIQAIRITCGQRNILGQRYTVKLIWNSCGTIPSWQKALVGQDASTTLARTSILGSFRQEANAEKIAGMIAEFAGASVQHRTSGKNSV